jgi:hypothetical protein
MDKPVKPTKAPKKKLGLSTDVKPVKEPKKKLGLSTDVKPKSKSACMNCGYEKPKVKKDVKPVICKICDKEFMPVDLKEHKKSISHIKRKMILDKLPIMKDDEIEQVLRI